MDAQAQVEKAIEIAWDPTVPPDIKPQALQFLDSFKSEPSAWQVSLSLFTRVPHASDYTRHYCIDVLNYNIQFGQHGSETLAFMRASLMDYVRQSYRVDSSHQDSRHIQNKLTQTLTYLFVASYASEWQSFFDDLKAVAGSGEAFGITNPVGSALYLRVLGSVHDEIADTTLPKDPHMQKTHTELKDLIRIRDAQKIALSWQEILAKWQWQQMDPAVVDMCLRTVGRWVMWTDIQLIVNETIISALFDISKRQDHAESRASAIDTFTEIIAKKMLPAEKVELMRLLHIDTVLGQLTAGPALADTSSPDYDTDLAEIVAKLVNMVLTQITDALSHSSALSTQSREHTDGLLLAVMPFLLRFFGDEYDEVCSTVMPSITELLTFFRLSCKGKEQTLASQYRALLLPLLEIVIKKMKIDESLSWGDDSEQTDEAEFQDLRKRLHTLQQTISTIDEQLYIDTLSQVVAGIFQSFEANPAETNWRDLDLALHEMYLFGELALRNHGLYAKREPSSLAAQRLVEMMSKMVETGVGLHTFPSIKLQFMEICVRYSSFFEQNSQYIPQVLEACVHIIHLDVIRVQMRSWYLFLRFVKQLRGTLGNVSQTVVQAIADLLPIKAEVPGKDEGADEMSSEDKYDSTDALFSSQLYLFESIGCLASAPSVPVEQKVAFAQSVMNPLFADIERHLELAKSGDERAILQIHHNIMALGTLARGFSDWMPGVNSGSPPPSEVGEEFSRALEAILTALGALQHSAQIRAAARFAFSRFIGVLGARIVEQLPRWLSGLLSESAANDEMAIFLRTFTQAMFAFKAEITKVLDDLLTPLLQRVFAGLAAPVNGTDDELLQKELKFEFLNFLLITLNQGLGSVLVSSTNQPMFDTVINAIAHYASDASDLGTVRSALGVCTRMTAVWGGPDVALPNVPGQQAAVQQNGAPSSPQPLLPGFDSFAVNRFSPLVWIVPASQQFRAKDAQSRTLVSEMANLQEMILHKTGALYLDTLRTQLAGMGAGDADVERYVAALVDGAARPRREEVKLVKGTLVGFKGFLASFLDRGG